MVAVIERYEWHHFRDDDEADSDMDVDEDDPHHNEPDAMDGVGTIPAWGWGAS